jgi:hypothetical protein
MALAEARGAMGHSRYVAFRMAEAAISPKLDRPHRNPLRRRARLMI